MFFLDQCSISVYTSAVCMVSLIAVHAEYREHYTTAFYLILLGGSNFKPAKTKKGKVTYDALVLQLNSFFTQLTDKL